MTTATLHVPSPIEKAQEINRLILKKKGLSEIDERITQLATFINSKTESQAPYQASPFNILCWIWPIATFFKNAETEIEKALLEFCLKRAAFKKSLSNGDSNEKITEYLLTLAKTLYTFPNSLFSQETKDRFISLMLHELPASHDLHKQFDQLKSASNAMFILDDSLNPYDAIQNYSDLRRNFTSSLDISISNIYYLGNPLALPVEVVMVK